MTAGGGGLGVLVTRPDSSGTARRLHALGHRPVLLPLSRVVELEPGPNRNPAAVRAVAATSANALRFCSPALLDAMKGKPCFAVGEATARAAREKGFSRIQVGEGDVQALAERIGPHAAPLLYLCGRVRRPEFEDALARKGVMVRAVETYDTVAVEPSSAALAEALDGRPVHAALLYSALGAEGFARLRQRADAAALRGVSVLALSPRIAKAAGGGLAAKAPNEDALFALFEAWAASFQPGRV
jgi:uroporphyrinogen-III synthase